VVDSYVSTKNVRVTQINQKALLTNNGIIKWKSPEKLNSFIPFSVQVDSR
jgi:hypothetical protein